MTHERWCAPCDKNYPAGTEHCLACGGSLVTRNSGPSFDEAPTTGDPATDAALRLAEEKLRLAPD